MPAHRGQSGRCTVCTHAEKARIELLIAGGGASHRAVGRKYSLSHYAIGRHWKNCVSDERKAALVFGPVEREALASRVAEESSSVMDHFRAIRSGLYQLYCKALEAGDGQTGAMLAGRLHEGLNSMARITGEIANSPLVQHNNNTLIMASPLMQDLQQMLIRTLQPYPEARSAVLTGLQELSARALPQTVSAPSQGLLIEARSNG
jgi:hypothetical protein